jgi:hypothetical protein
MANPQPSDAHGIIAHEIQENILIRDFSKQQLKIIYLVIRLSWGCALKAWRYKSYKDFEVIGLFKSDVKRNLEYLQINKIIIWHEEFRLISFNKNYDEWTIPVKANYKVMKTIVHESLKNANIVSELLMVLEKNEHVCLQNTNGVSEKSEQQNPDSASDEQIRGQPKESILKKDIKDIKSDCPFFDILDLFNNTCTSLTRVQKLTNSRKDKLSARWKEMPDIAQWKQLFDIVECSTFLNGQNDRGWRANFDWLIKNDSNYTKVLEGQYNCQHEEATSKPNEDYMKLKASVNNGSQ